MTRITDGHLRCVWALFVVIGCVVAGCDGSVKPTPSPEVIETAQSVSNEVIIPAPVSTTPEADGEEGDDPIPLHGRIFGSGSTGVILAHMRPADQTAWFPFATELAARAGMTVLTFDFRGFGTSPGEKDFDRLDTDLAAAYDYMRNKLGITRIFLVGASMGGTASLVVASRVPVEGVVSISSEAQFQTLDALDVVSSVLAPKLFVTSKDDVPAARSEKDLFAAAPEPKQQHVYDGDLHGTDLLDGADAMDLSERLIEFLVSR